MLDLGSFKSIKQFAEEVKKTTEKLHSLILNAGIARYPFGLTEDGIEQHMGLNSLLLLLELFLLLILLNFAFVFFLCGLVCAKKMRATLVVAFRRESLWPCVFGAAVGGHAQEVCHQGVACYHCCWFGFRLYVYVGRHIDIMYVHTYLFMYLYLSLYICKNLYIYVYLDTHT